MNSDVSCEVCGEKLLAKNLKRHVGRLHSASKEKVCSSVSYIENVEHDGGDCGVIFEPMEFKVDSETVNEAVITILENHQAYTRPAMMSLLEQHFPEVPPGARHLFITVATSAARYVASIEEIRRAAGESRSEKGMRTVKKAADSLMSWRHGLRHVARSTPHVPPQPVSESTLSNTPATDILLQSLRESGLPVVAPPDPELEAMIEEELGQPPVITDLSIGIPSQDDQPSTFKNSVSGTDAAVPPFKYRRLDSSSRRSGNGSYSTPYDCRRAGRLSQDEVEPYSPQPYVRPETNRQHRANKFAIGHRRRHH